MMSNVDVRILDVATDVGFPRHRKDLRKRNRKRRKRRKEKEEKRGTGR